MQIAVEAREVLEGEGTPTRVVSMPSVEWFEAQDEAYKQQVLPPSVRARVSVEAGIALGWRGYVGDAGESVSLEHFGASADYKTLYQQFGYHRRPGRGRGARQPDEGRTRPARVRRRETEERA